MEEIEEIIIMEDINQIEEQMAIEDTKIMTSIDPITVMETIIDKTITPKRTCNRIKSNTNQR